MAVWYRLGISGAVVFLCERSVDCRSDNENQITVRRLHDHSPQLGHHGQLRELHAPTFWYQTLLVMLSPTFGLKHGYPAVTKSACFSSRLAYSLLYHSYNRNCVRADLNALLLRHFFSCWSTFYARAHLGYNALL